MTGKMSVGHAKLRSSIATLLTFVSTSDMFLNLIRTSDGADLIPGFSLEPTRIAAYGEQAASDRGLDTVGTCICLHLPTGVPRID